jgi:predicted nucleotidyltransferase
MEIREVQLKINPILKQFGVKRAAVFGSLAKGTSTQSSDIDLMVELYEPLGLLQFARLNYLLEDALQKKVDLVKVSALKPGFRKSIMENAQYIYEQ